MHVEKVLYSFYRAGLECIENFCEGGKFGAFQAKLKERNDSKFKRRGWNGFAEGRYDLSSTSSTFEKLSSPKLPKAPPTPDVDGDGSRMLRRFENFDSFE